MWENKKKIRVEDAVNFLWNKYLHAFDDMKSPDMSGMNCYGVAISFVKEFGTSEDVDTFIRTVLSHLGGQRFLVDGPPVSLAEKASNEVREELLSFVAGQGMYHQARYIAKLLGRELTREEISVLTEKHSFDSSVPNAIERHLVEDAFKYDKKFGNKIQNRFVNLRKQWDCCL